MENPAYAEDYVKRGEAITPEELCVKENNNTGGLLSRMYSALKRVGTSTKRAAAIAVISFCGGALYGASHPAEVNDFTENVKSLVGYEQSSEQSPEQSSEQSLIETKIQKNYDQLKLTPEQDSPQYGGN